MLSAKLFSSTLSLGLLIAIGASADDFALATLKQAQKPSFDLADFAKSKSFYEFMHASLGPKIQELASSAKKPSTNQEELENGNGVSVRLSKNNYNIHINFPNAAEGGRSYGWTSGQVGDWSDKMYLDHLANLSDSDLGAFYETVINMLGACDTSGLEDLKNPTQRIATNFLAIYTAEEYRSMVPAPHQNWDDALMEVTLLGAFHTGQSKLTKYYAGNFSTQSKQQAPGVYNRGKAGPSAADAKDKAAALNDYWQDSADPTSRQSGINISRSDFEKMGKSITAYYTSNQDTELLSRIQTVVGESDNVIKGISSYYASGKSRSAPKTASFAKDVSNFMVGLHRDADKITKWISDSKL